MSIIKEIEKIMFENKGKIYAIQDFQYLGKYGAIKTALFRLEKANKIVKLFKGLYVYPKFIETIKENTLPNFDDFICKIEEKQGPLIPYNELLLNQIGISMQVPNQYYYASNCHSCSIFYKNKQIKIFRLNDKYFSFPRGVIMLILAIKILKKVSHDDLLKLKKYTQQLNLDLNLDFSKLPKYITKMIDKIKCAKI